MKVGFVGLGKLGLPTALAIESRGHDVMGYDVNRYAGDLLDGTLNRINSSFAAIQYGQARGSSFYNGANVSVRKRRISA